MDGARSGEAGSSETLAAALRSTEYQEARRSWLREVTWRAIATGASGVILFVAIQLGRALPSLADLEGSVPLAFWGQALGRPTGLSDDVAASVVTALVALVATLNVAVVVATWRAPTLDVHHVQTSMWIGAMIVVVTLSGTVAVLTAMTQFLERPALGLLLFAIACLAIIAAAATQRRPTDWLPAVFRLAAAERRFDIASHVRGHVQETWPRVDGGNRASRGVGLFLLVVGLTVVSSSIVVIVVWGWASIAGREVVVPTWEDVVLAVVWTAFPVLCSVAISMTRHHLRVAAQARKMLGVRTLSAAWYRFAHWAVWGVGCLLLYVWAYSWRLPGGTMPAGFWSYAFAFQPVAMSVAALALGRRRGWRPGLWAAQWTVHAADNEVVLAERAMEHALQQVGAAHVAVVGNGADAGSEPARRTQQHWAFWRRSDR